MSRPSWLQKIYWSHFAKPVEERALFSHLLSTPVDSLLELGVGLGERMKRIAKLAQPHSKDIRFVGTDPFESSPAGRAHLPLKQAHQVAGRLGKLGFRASLIPGDVQAALPRVAHKFGVFDLIIINEGFDASQPDAGVIGPWLDRIAHQDTVIFYSAHEGGPLEKIAFRELSRSSNQAA